MLTGRYLTDPHIVQWECAECKQMKSPMLDETNHGEVFFEKITSKDGSYMLTNYICYECATKQ